MLRKSGKTLILFLSLSVISSVGSTKADWGPDVRLTYNDSSSMLCSSDNGHSVAVDSLGRVHVIWNDFRDPPAGKGEIYYKRSTDWGNSWEPDVRLTSDTVGPWTPIVDADRQGRIHVAWMDRRYGPWEIFYKRSTDGGVSWEPDVSLSDSGQFDYLFLRGIASDEQGWVHLVCINRVLNPPQPIKLWYRRSRDAGGTWDPWVLLKDSLNSYVATLASGSGHGVHILTGYPYYLRSSDGGTTWKDTVLSVTPFVLQPRLNVDRANRVHALWMDQREGPFIYELYYKQSPDGGVTWQPDLRLTHSDTMPDHDAVIAGDSTGVIHLIYDVPPYQGLFYKRSTDAGTTWEPSYQLVPNYPSTPHIAVDSKENAHVVFVNTPVGGSSGEIYYKKWTVPTAVQREGNKPFPQKFGLQLSSPNQKNLIFFYILEKDRVIEIALFNVLGQKLQTLVRGRRPAGQHKGQYPLSLPSGIYFARLSSGENQILQRFIVVR